MKNTIKPGDRQIEDGKVFRKDTGASPNGTANQYLAAAKGKQIVIRNQDLDVLSRGELVAFDAYSMAVQEGDRPFPTLLFKGPGLKIDVEPDDGDQ